MPLRNVKTLETYTFTDAAALRDWLNQFSDKDLSTVYFGDVLTLHYDEETLSDGSKVHNIRVGG